MEKNVRIARELVRIAKQLMAGGMFDTNYEPISLKEAAQHMKEYEKDVQLLKSKFGGVANAMNAETKAVAGTDWSQNNAVKLYYKVKRPDNVSIDTAISLADKAKEYNTQTFGDWKLFRVYDNGKQALVTRLNFDRNASDLDKIETMEKEIAKTKFEMPDDCDFYTENDDGDNKYVLKHDDGKVEFEMRFDPSYTKKWERGNNGQKELDKIDSGVEIPQGIDSESMRMLNFSFTLDCKPVGEYNDNNGNHVEDLSSVYRFNIAGQYDCKSCVANGNVSVFDAAGKAFLGFSGVGSFAVDYQKEDHPSLFEAVKTEFDKIIETMDQNRIRIASKYTFSRSFIRMAKEIARRLGEIQ